MLRLESAFLAIPLLAGALTGAASLSADEVVFLRGDSNSDGEVSIADALMSRRYLFLGAQAPECFDAADADDDGRLTFTDVVKTLNGLFLEEFSIPAPFPQAGVDPTPDTDLPCPSYTVTPPSFTDDLLRIGDVEASPGQEVEIPVYLTSSVEVDGFQLIVRYDPAVFTPRTNLEGPPFSFLGTPWEAASVGGGAPQFRSLRRYPDQQLFSVALIGNFSEEGFEVPPGPEQLVFKIRGTVSPDAEPGSQIVLEPTNGPDGKGSIPPYNLLNEVAHRGTARFVSFILHTAPGLIEIVEDVTFFRGDSNRDDTVDISDAAHVLNSLFSGGPASTCQDASDADDNGTVELTDAVVILHGLFVGDEVIAPPYPEAGHDSTPDSLPTCR